MIAPSELAMNPVPSVSGWPFMLYAVTTTIDFLFSLKTLSESAKPRSGRNNNAHRKAKYFMNLSGPF
jgi:hypothetical protein